MYNIVRDDREKNGYESFPGEEVVVKRLDTGDYTIEGFEDVFAVERKSLNDLATSVGYNRLRFENEIRRANGYAERNEDGNPLPGTKPDKPMQEFAVVIEAHKSEVHFQNYYSNIHPNAIKGTVDKWPQKYDVLDMYWAGSWRQGKQKTLQLLDEWYLQYADPGEDF